MINIPKRPQTDTPPARLRQYRDQALSNPAIAQVGFTTTSEGEWGLLISLEKGIQVSVAQIQALAPDYPVIISEDSATLPVARPAYPEYGE